MIPDGYVQSLVTYADTFGTVGKQEIKDELKLLFERMQEEEGTAVVNSAVSGKNFGFQVTMTVEEKFTAFAAAWKVIDGGAGSSPITFPDWSESSP
jgi:hypothetical protein